MKKTLLITFLLCSVAVWGQDYTNGINGQIEFYDDNGNKIGYTKYNDAYEYWEYYDQNGHMYKTKTNIDKNRAEYYNSFGKLLGSEIYREAYERTDCYDSDGRRTGYLRYDDFSNCWEIYDNDGRKVATCEWNDLKKHWEYKKLR